MEGKETRFGIATSGTWAFYHGCFQWLRQLHARQLHASLADLCSYAADAAEVVFGGTGCGLYGMLGFAILTVFIAGLMVGRTPEYLCKKDRTL